MRRALVAAAAATVLSACSEDRTPVAPPPSASSTPPAPTPAPVAPSVPAPSPPAATPSSPPRADPAGIRTDTAMAAVRELAGRIGPRPGTSPAFFEAAAYVEGRFAELGWTATRQEFAAPAGVSWGEPVEGGASVNLVATRGDVVPGEPWLLVGAHLDTVPQAPGAEDNASGIGALLAVAEATAGARTRLPVVLVAFGAEEPRGAGDELHHFGSRAYVASLTPAERDTLAGMVALDRVGVGTALVVSSAGTPDPSRAGLLAAAARAGVPTDPMVGDRASDHWSFVREGLPGARLGSTPYAGYHSAGDVVSVVDPAQVMRAARTVVAWLR